MRRIAIIVSALAFLYGCSNDKSSSAGSDDQSALFKKNPIKKLEGTGWEVYSSPSIFDQFPKDTHQRRVSTNARHLWEKDGCVSPPENKRMNKRADLVIHSAVNLPARWTNPNGNFSTDSDGYFNINIEVIGELPAKPMAFTPFSKLDELSIPADKSTKRASIWVSYDVEGFMEASYKRKDWLPGEGKIQIIKISDASYTAFIQAAFSDGQKLDVKIPDLKFEYIYEKHPGDCSAPN